MTSIQAAPSTPPPPSRIHSPPTPRLGGFSDSWEPFSPRRSARISAKRTSIARTPSPSSSVTSPRNLSHQLPHSANKATASTIESSTMASPARSPIKKHAAANSRVRSTTIAAEDPANATSRLGTNAPAGSCVLPTPAKTPDSKYQPEMADSNLESVARNIYDEILPSSKTRRQRHYQGISLESFAATEVQPDIKIHVDSQERIPIIDDSTENPFRSRPTRIGATLTRSLIKRTAVKISGEESQSLDDALRREDGMVYVFRGKKKFRKFKQDSDSPESPSRPAAERPLTRSTIKPRLLFPPKISAAPDVVEEEAPTDIEDSSKLDDAQPEAKKLKTPSDTADHIPITPKAPKFAPASPPTTGRVFRSKASATKSDREAKRSAFKGWRLTKNGAQGQKRQHESSLQEAAPKRARI